VRVKADAPQTAFEPNAPRVSARAEETAARAALMDTGAAAWAASSATRRSGAIADAVTEQTLVVERLGQSDRRMPAPARRRGEAE